MSEETKKILHDLCTPLSVIKTFLSNIGEVDMPKNIRELHDAAKRGMEKVIEIIDRNM